MRKPTIENKYNLNMSKVNKLIIKDRSQVNSPLFWRNNAINAWCISGNTIQSDNDSRYGTYSEYWIGIYDEDSKIKRQLKVNCNSHGGMCGYNFKDFFNPKEIENEHDLKVQEGLLKTVNMLIDNGILDLCKN